MKIAVTGSSGLIGTAVCTALHSDGHQVVRLVRGTPTGPGQVRWDPRAPGGGLAADALAGTGEQAGGTLAGTGAVVHLAGAPIAGRRWTAAYRAEIRNSRVLGTQALVGALARLAEPPAVLLSGSAIGWYGDTGGQEVDETSPNGSGFLPEVVREWEAAAEAASEAGIRVVRLRTGLVLSPAGGVLGRLLPLFRLGRGARLGSGQQVMSWVSLTDVTAMVRFLLAQDISGPVNVTAPAPVTNAEFTRALAAALHRPAMLAVPVPALRLALGGVSADLLSSARVRPARLAEAGFQHQHPTLPSALAAELARPR